MMFFNVSAGFAERKRDMALLRMVGARPSHLVNLTLAEPLLQVVLALGLGTLLYAFSLWLIQAWLPVIDQVSLPLQHFSWLLLVFVAGFAMACLPAWKIYGASKRL